MITISGTNKWTPAIYKNESPVNWAAERNKSINFRNLSVHSNRQKLIVAKK